MKISIVIPVYNEEKTLLDIVLKVQEAVLPKGCEKEIIIVNDCSIDDTARVLDKLNDENVKFSTIKLTEEKERP